MKPLSGLPKDYENIFLLFTVIILVITGVKSRRGNVSVYYYWPGQNAAIKQPEGADLKIVGSSFFSPHLVDFSLTLKVLQVHQGPKNPLHWK